LQSKTEVTLQLCNLCHMEETMIGIQNERPNVYNLYIPALLLLFFALKDIDE